jgi:hypothetical protein
MQFGGAMFFTDYSMSASELAHALEERGRWAGEGAAAAHGDRQAELPRRPGPVDVEPDAALARRESS